MASLSVTRTQRTVHDIQVVAWNARCNRCGWHTETRDEPLALALARNHKCAVGE